MDTSGIPRVLVNWARSHILDVIFIVIGLVLIYVDNGKYVGTSPVLIIGGIMLLLVGD